MCQFSRPYPILLFETVDRITRYLILVQFLNPTSSLPHQPDTSESAYYRSRDDFHSLGSSPNQSGLDLATTHVSDLENQDAAPFTPIIPGNESTLLLLGKVISVSQPTTSCHDHQPDPILPPLEITSSTCFSPSGHNPIGHLLSPCSSLSDLSATPVLDTEDWDIQSKGMEQEAARFGETRNTTPSSQLSSPDSELITLGNSQSGPIDPWEDELFIPLEHRLSGCSLVRLQSGASPTHKDHLCEHLSLFLFFPSHV
jgi:hypothetical protein